MKQRSKILTALFLSASLAVTPAASVSVLAEDLDFAAVEEIDVVPEEEISDSEEVSTSTEDSVLAADITTEDSDLTTDEFTADTSTFSADEADVFTSGETSEQDVSEARTHSIKVSVTNSEGVASGMYAMDDAIVTKQDDGTYLVKMHQASENRNYMALVNGTTADDIAAATQHKIDWYVADSSYYYTIPVASLSDTVYASFSKTTNVNKGSKWSNVQTITFDTTSMADTDKNDVDASGMNKQAALDYSSVDAALATVPEDLSIYTDETANAVTSAVKALSGTYKAATQDDVDKLATAITDAVNALVERGLLTVTNETLMFNVEKAILRDGNLILTLHGTGYHYLYKGTYEEAVANGDNRDNWIAGEEVNGKWQFTVPVAEGETYLPIVAISNSYLTKYEEGKNSLERAFYPRQAVIDQDAATLVTGDYDHTKDLTVDNSVKMFNVAAASLETIGGPNSNNYKEILHLTMGSDSFDKVFIGFAKDAAKAETTADITDRKVSFDMKANAMGGAATTDYLDKEVIFSFHSVKNGTWYERVFNVSKTNGTLTITPVAAADYTAVDAALAAVPKDLSIYTDETVAAVRAAVDAVNKNCTVYQQADVDKMASDITAAVKALVKKPVAAAKVTLNATSKKITTGKSFTLKATVAPSNTTDKVVWKSSNTKVATVSANGTVKAVKAGTAVITATAGKVKATCKVTVANPVYKVTSIKLAAAPSRYITAGKRVQLRATITPSNATNKAVTWKSSNTRIATVSSTGIVTFNKNAGGKKVTITATAKDGSKKYARITLACMKGSVKSIRLSGKTTVTNGQSTKVTAAVTSQGGSANRSLAWSSSNTKLAIVDKYGKVKTIKGKKGTVTITAKATDGSGKKATFKIRIK
nr:Ig-like domain-containing protein [uncultured Blautia sp.]